MAPCCDPVLMWVSSCMRKTPRLGDASRSTRAVDIPGHRLHTCRAARQRVPGGHAVFVAAAASQGRLTNPLFSGAADLLKDSAVGMPPPMSTPRD
jgi:hypothetical protein